MGQQRHSKKDKKKRKCILIIVIIIIILIAFLLLMLHKKEYEITFNSNGGSEVVSVKVKENDKIEEPENPTREGYNFVGWYYLEELYDFNTLVKGDMTLEAKWEEIEDEEVEGVSLNVTELTLEPNGTATLVATILPENANQVKLIWTSSDNNIAIVDEYGNIKALKDGTVTITVSTEDKKYTASCTVTIKQAEEEVETETKSEENTKNNNNSNKAKTPSTSSKSNTPNASSTPSQPSTPNAPSQPNQPSTPSQPSTPNPPKESTYTIYLTAKVMEGTGAITQYNFRVEKDGVAFTGYTVFNYNGKNISRTSGTVRAGLVDKGKTTATITLTDGTIKNAKVVIN